MKLTLAISAVLFAAAFATPSSADTITLGATLSGQAEVPANASVASGTGRFSYDTVTRQLTYSVRFSKLSGSATAADICGPAGPTSVAPVAVNFYVPESPISGNATLTDMQAKALLAGQFYVEINSSAFPKGEIRGQIHR